MENILFIVSGPSGAGKNTVMTHIRKTFPEITKGVTYTTRKPRPNERHGVDYRFITEGEFFAKVDSGDILEYEQVYNDYYYGSPADIFSFGKAIIMEMDWKGHRTYREHYTNIKLASIFVVPPSLEEIRQRILGRSTVDNLNSRMANALEQLEHASEYDYILINDERDKTLQAIEAIVRAEFLHLGRSQQLRFIQDTYF